MSSTPDLDDTLDITVKRVNGGIVSNFLNDRISAGDSLQLMDPKGAFSFVPDKNKQRHIILFAAGSGITPLMSIAKSALFFESKTLVSLIYGNRHEGTVIFRKQLDELKSRFSDRFNIVPVYSQPDKLWNGYKGRIDAVIAVNVLNLLPKLSPEQTFYYLCGPDGMMEEVKIGLKKLQVKLDHIHFESFTSSNESEEALAGLGLIQEREVVIKLNGDTYNITVPPKKAYLRRVWMQG